MLSFVSLYTKTYIAAWPVFYGCDIGSWGWYYKRLSGSHFGKCLLEVCQCAHTTFFTFQLYLLCDQIEIVINNDCLTMEYCKDKILMAGNGFMGI